MVASWYAMGSDCTNYAMRAGDSQPSFGAAGTCAGLGSIVPMFTLLSVLAAIGVIVLVLINARRVWMMSLIALPLVTILLVYRAYL